MPKWTAEQAKEMASRGGRARAERMKALAGRTPEQAARELLMAESRELVGLLLKAAKGEPPFEDLPADKRLTALQRCLEYSLGRPTPGPKVEAEKQDDGPGLVME